MNRRTVFALVGLVCAAAVGAGLYFFSGGSGGGSGWSPPSANRSNPAAATVPLRITYVQVLSGLPLYIAVQDGLMAKADLVKPSLEPHDSSDLAANQVKTGTADACFAGLSQVLQVEANNPGSLKIVAVLYSSTCLISATRPGAPQSIAELRGKKIGVFPGNTFETYVEKTLEKEGLERGSYTMIKLPPPLQLQQLGAPDGVDAVLSMEPVGGQAVARGIGRYLADEDVFARHFLNGQHFPGGVVAVSREYLKRNPGAEQEIVRSLQEAMDRISAAGFKQDAYLKRYTKITDSDAAVLKFEGGEVGPRIDPEPLRRVTALLKEWGKLPENADVDRTLAP